MTVHYAGERTKKNRFRGEAVIRKKRGAYDALGPRPDAVIVEISLRYDNRLLAEFDDNPTNVVQWLNKVVGLAKIRMSLIHRRVVLRVVGSAERFNKNIRLDTIEDLVYWQNKIKDTLKNKWTRGPISYFCGSSNAICCKYFIVFLIVKLLFFNSGPGTWNGIAGNISTACDRLSGEQFNIVKKQNSISFTSYTLAHELGHNIGMK